MIKNLSQKRKDRQDTLAINMGLFANLTLALVKLVVGFFASSSALISDGVNSASDTAYYIITKIFLRASNKPPDEEHPYGHRQMENITSIVVGTFILVTALLLFSSSLNSMYEILFTNKTIVISKFSRISFFVAAATVLVKLSLYLFTKSTYRKTSNTVTKALATDHLNDILTALAASLGILASLYNYSWADPLAGSLVAIFIFYTGLSIIRESASHIMSSVPSETLQKQVQAVISEIPGITCHKNLRVHTFGQYFVLTMTIGVDGTITVQEGDKIADLLEEKLHKSLRKLLAVHIHYHPAHQNPIST